MRNLLFTVLIALFVCSFSGCGDDTTTTVSRNMFTDTEGNALICIMVDDVPHLCFIDNNGRVGKYVPLADVVASVVERMEEPTSMVEEVMEVLEDELNGTDTLGDMKTDEDSDDNQEMVDEVVEIIVEEEMIDEESSPEEFVLMDTEAQVEAPANVNYTFETIEVPGVDFLAITASSDFEDYAGYTKSADGEKEVAFTLIDGVFTTYDFPGAKNTYFYALGNNGNAAGHYEDSDGLFHGVILEDGELRQYDYPNAVQTEIYGISDATGVLTGNFIDATGVRR